MAKTNENNANTLDVEELVNNFDKFENVEKYKNKLQTALEKLGTTKNIIVPSAINNYLKDVSNKNTTELNFMNLSLVHTYYNQIINS